MIDFDGSSSHESFNSLDAVTKAIGVEQHLEFASVQQREAASLSAIAALESMGVIVDCGANDA